MSPFGMAHDKAAAAQLNVADDYEIEMWANDIAFVDTDELLKKHKEEYDGFEIVRYDEAIQEVEDATVYGKMPKGFAFVKLTKEGSPDVYGVVDFNGVTETEVPTN